MSMAVPSGALGVVAGAEPVDDDRGLVAHDPGVVAAGQRGDVARPATNSVPSSMRIASRPLTWYWKCGASQLAVLASGLTSLDQRQPGSKTSRPTSPPPICRISAWPLGNSRVSSGAPKLLCSVCCMARLLRSGGLARPYLLVGRMARPDFDLCEDGPRCRPSRQHRGERHRHPHPRHRRAARAGPRLQRLQLRRRRRRARHDHGGPALPLPRQGRAGPGADRALHASASLAALADIDARIPDAPAKLDAYAGLYADVLRGQRMCLCGMLAAEYQTLPDPMRDAVIAFIDANEAWVEQVLSDGRRAGTIAVAGTASRRGAPDRQRPRGRDARRAPVRRRRALRHRRRGAAGERRRAIAGAAVIR